MWLVILLSVFILLLLIVIIFLSKALIIQSKKNTIYEQWIVDIQNKVEDVYNTMRQIDSQEWFSTDDDVGVVFKRLVELIEYLDEKTTKE